MTAIGGVRQKMGVWGLFVANRQVCRNKLTKKTTKCLEPVAKRYIFASDFIISTLVSYLNGLFIGFLSYFVSDLRELGLL